MKKEIQVWGTYKLNQKVDSFNGSIKFEENENYIYYTWNLFDKNEELIAGQSLRLDFQQIPTGYNKLEFSKSHAIEGIKNYRIGREKIIQELGES